LSGIPDASVLPVEVKAGATGLLKALRQMVIEKHLDRAIRFDAGKFSKQNVRIGDNGCYELTTLPFYAVDMK
jgi:hypothetical protein